MSHNEAITIIHEADMQGRAHVHAGHLRSAAANDGELVDALVAARNAGVKIRGRNAIPHNVWGIYVKTRVNERGNSTILFAGVLFVALILVGITLFGIAPKILISDVVLASLQGF
jgi:hypothetical protein